MPKPIEAGKSSLDTPRSSHSSSTESNRHSSLRTYYPEKDLELVSTSPRMRLTRKRAALLDVDSANEPRIGDLALDSASTNGPPSSVDSTREQVCLCQPDPKIPRPRNAFILYRQHMQAQVVAAHPGLANPEISKIIGEQWKNQTAEVKTTWKQLAEEEKQRHSRQYPGYRYQPRRAGKTNSANPVSAVSENGPTRCPKCNGRYISTPSTPLTPFTPGFRFQGPRPERAPPPFTASRISESERDRYPSQMQPSRMDSLHMTMPSQQMYNRRVPYPPSQYMPTHHERDDEIDLLSPTPEQKRRRYNDGPRYSISSPTQYSQQQQSFGRSGGGGAPMSAGGYRHQQPSLPGPGNMISRPIQDPGSNNMGQTIQQAPHHPYTTRSSTSSHNFDESLRLPPLQTHVHNASSSQLHALDHSTNSTRESQARSVEAMVMTIPYTTKIKILHRISPPLIPPGPTSPALETRGAVIAIEGYNQDLLRDVGNFVEETLKGDSSFEVRTWETLPLPHEGVRQDIEMSDIPVSPKGKEPEREGERDPFVEYLSIISSMHRKSHEISKHITTIPSTSTQTQHKIPIALLPAGFSLATSDTFALRIPINDSYAPIDHWQWMATLWRGIIGPDLTVYVTRVGREEYAKFGGVEIRADVGGIVVRVLGEDESGEREGWIGIDEKTRRRLGFEVLEFVRGGEGGWGRG